MERLGRGQLPPSPPQQVALLVRLLLAPLPVAPPEAPLKLLLPMVTPLPRDLPWRPPELQLLRALAQSEGSRALSELAPPVKLPLGLLPPPERVPPRTPLLELLRVPALQALPSVFLQMLPP